MVAPTVEFSTKPESRLALANWRVHGRKPPGHDSPDELVAAPQKYRMPGSWASLTLNDRRSDAVLSFDCKRIFTCSRYTPTLKEHYVFRSHSTITVRPRKTLPQPR